MSFVGFVKKGKMFSVSSNFYKMFASFYNINCKISNIFFINEIFSNVYKMHLFASLFIFINFFLATSFYKMPPTKNS